MRPNSVIEDVPLWREEQGQDSVDMAQENKMQIAEFNSDYQDMVALGLEKLGQRNQRESAFQTAEAAKPAKNDQLTSTEHRVWQSSQKEQALTANVFNLMADIESEKDEQLRGHTRNKTCLANAAARSE